jgi:predicted kinase
MPGSVTVLCGPSGFGKSTYAKSIHGDKTIVSADSYFMMNSSDYIFNPRELQEAHSMCLRNYVSALSYAVPDKHIIVDNPNTELHDISPYTRLAQAYGRTPHVVAFVTPDIRAAAARNIHGVPYKTVVKQYDAMCGMLVDNLGVNFKTLLTAGQDKKTVRFPVLRCDITLL